MADAGLGAAAGPEGPGLEEDQLVTMDDRSKVAASMEDQGRSPDEVALLLQGYPTRLREPPLEGRRDDDEGLGRLDLIVPGAQQAAADVVHGTARALDYLFDTDIGDTAEDWSDLNLGPSEETRAKMNQRYVDRAVEAEDGEIGETERLAGDVGDAIAENAGDLALGVGGAAAAGKLGAGRGVGRLLGAATQAVGGRFLPFGLEKYLAKGVEKATPAMLGFMAGALPDFSSAYVEGRDKLEADGIDPDDPEYQNRLFAQAVARGALGAWTPLKILDRVGGDAAERVARRSLARGAAIEGGKSGLREGLSEGMDMVIQEAILDDEVIRRVKEEDWKDLAPWLVDRYGRDGAIAVLAGAGLGGGAGVPAGARGQMLDNALAKENVRRLATSLEPLGLSGAEIERMSDDRKKAEDLGRAAADIGDAETVHLRTLRGLDEAQAEVGDDEEGRARIQSGRDESAARRDQVVDKWAKKLGAPMTTVDLKRQNDEEARMRREGAVDRLRELGQGVNRSVDGKVVEEQASKLETAEAEARRARDRAALPTTGERSADARRQLLDAESDLHKARVEARMKLQGMNHAQAVRQARRDVARGDAEARLKGQAQGREEAIARQAAAEFPESMSPDEQVERAREIISAARTKPGRGDKGLNQKISRLRGRRRGATDPDEIDRLSDEIADLEARRGLSAPAVEAARRVLQAQGEEVSPSAAEESPSDDTGVAEPAAPAADGEAPPRARGRGPEPEVEGDAEGSRPAAEPEPAGASAAPAGEASPSLDLVRTPGGEARGEAPEFVDLIGEALPEVDPARRAGLVDAIIADEGGMAGRRRRRKEMSEAVGRKLDPEEHRQIEKAVRRAGSAELRQALFSNQNLQRIIEGRASPGLLDAALRAAKSTGRLPEKATVDDLPSLAEAIQTGQRMPVEKDAAFGVQFPRSDPIHEGYDLGLRYPWSSLVDEVGRDATLEEAQQRLHDWSILTGHEASMIFDGAGRLAGAGTNGSPNGVMMPKAAVDERGVMVHTHPVDTPFSHPDILGMFDDMLDQRVLLPDGQVLEMRPLMTREEFFALPGRGEEFLTDLYRHIFFTIPNPTPAAGPRYDVLRARGEALLQALEAKGVLEYTTPLNNVTAWEQEQISNALDALEEDGLLGPPGSEPDAAAGRGDDAGQGSADVREGGEQSGAEGAGPSERGAGPRPRPRQGLLGDAGVDEGAVDVGEDDDVEDDFGRVARPPAIEVTDENRAIAERVSRKGRPSADPERVSQLGDQVWEHIQKVKRGPLSHVRQKIIDGELTREKIDLGLQAMVNNNGNKESWVILHMAEAMFPEARITEADVTKHTPTASETGSKPYWVPSKEKTAYLNATLQVLNGVDASTYGGINRIPLSLRNRRRLNYGKYFLSLDPKLKEFLQFTTPEQSKFYPPMEDPDNVDFIRLHGGSNAFTDRGLEPGIRTAQNFQRRRYTIDMDALAKLTPDDMVSGKALGAIGLRPQDDPLGRWRELDQRRNRWTEGETAWMEKYGQDLKEKLQVATAKLERLRGAVDDFHKVHGEGAEVGFVYQLDNKGRIYADGEFNPQTSDAVKGIFKHEGVSLKDMTTVDNSASGWQVSALLARDHVAAKHINLDPGKALREGEGKNDLYLQTLARIDARIRDDAANSSDPKKRKHAKLLQKRILDNPEADFLNQRNGVKTPTIAVNYGGTANKFGQDMEKAFRTFMESKDYKPGSYPWGYMGNVAYNSLEELAPHAMAFKKWSINALTKLVNAVEASDFTRPKLVFSVGIDGSFQSKKHGTLTVKQEAQSSNYPKHPEGNRKVVVEFKLRRGKVDGAATARTIYSQLIQGFDASILHRTIERYKTATGDAFVTSNHDSYTAPKEREGDIASAARESMRRIMEDQDYPRRLYDEMIRQADEHGVKLDIVPFAEFGAGYGDYDLASLDTSSPVFGETPEGKDYVPAYSKLPVGGARLRAAEAEAYGGPNGPLIIPTPRQRNAAVDIESYMEQLPAQADYVGKMKAVASEPASVMSKAVDALEDNIFNAFAPIRRLEKQIYDGVLPTGMDSAYKSVEVAVNDAGRNEMLLFAGAAKLGAHGEFTVADGTMGLKSIFKLAGGSGPERGQRIVDWMQWMAARRAKDLHDRGIKTPLTDDDITKAMAKERPEFVRAADEWKKFNDANLQFLQDTGRITEAQKTAMQADDHYVPFYRSDQRKDGTSPDLDLSDLDFKGRSRDIMARDPGIKKIVGGDKMRIANLMDNMIRNSQAMVAAGMRNRATNKTYDIMKETGLARFQPLSAKKPDPNAERVWRDGEEMWAIAQTEEAWPLMMALRAMTPPQRDGIYEVARKVGSMFRQGITLTPIFMLRNLYRGAVSTGVLTNAANLRLTNNTLTGMWSALANNGETQAFKAQSGMGDFRFGDKDVGFGKDDMLIEFGVKDPGVVERMGYTWRKAFDRYEKLGTATELADRVAAYNTMIRNNMRPDEAAYQALTIMNYGRKGRSGSLNFLMPLVPFLNARLQGWSRLAEGAVTPGGRAKALGKLAVNGAILTAISLAAMNWVLDDEENWERYQKEPLWRRLNYHIFYVGGDPVYVPKAFEIGHIFSTMPELMALQMLTDMDDFGEGVKKIMMDTFVFNVIPASVQPALEAMMNKDFYFDRPIEGLRESRRLPEDRITGASEFAIALGRDLGLSNLTIGDPEKGGLDLRLSPKMITHLMDGYAGIGGVITDMIWGVVAEGTGASPPQPAGAFGKWLGDGTAARLADAMLGSAYYDGDLQVKRFVDDVYTLSDRMAQSYYSAKDAAESGQLDRARRIAEDMPGLAAQHKLLSKTIRELGKINAEIRDVRRDTSITVEKRRRRLSALRRQQNKVAESGWRAAKEIERKAIRSRELDAARSARTER